jgi:DNA-binding LacI/PurR family transcriptional regulator
VAIRQRVGIAEIAILAGVSKPTVSRALAGHPDVNPETERKVLQAADQIGYIPSRSAQALRTGRFHSLGMAIPMDTESWAFDFQAGVAHEVGLRGYSLMLQPLANARTIERDFVTRTLRSMPIDGLILFMTDGLLPYAGELKNMGLPVVAFDDRGAIRDIPTVATTNEIGAHEAVTHLIETGRRRIALICGPLNCAYARERMAGYRRALHEHGLEIDPALILTEEATEPCVRDLIAGLRDGGTAFDAIFACHDGLAIDALTTLRKAGIRVPEDVAVVGFDDIAPASTTYPSLTTIRQPFYEMGATAVRMLFTALEGGPAIESCVLPTKLVIRESSV